MKDKLSALALPLNQSRVPIENLFSLSMNQLESSSPFTNNLQMENDLGTDALSTKLCFTYATCFRMSSQIWLNNLLNRRRGFEFRHWQNSLWSRQLDKKQKNLGEDARKRRSR